MGARLRRSPAGTVFGVSPYRPSGHLLRTGTGLGLGHALWISASGVVRDGAQHAADLGLTWLVATVFGLGLLFAAAWRTFNRRPRDSDCRGEAWDRMPRWQLRIEPTVEVPNHRLNLVQAVRRPPGTKAMSNASGRRWAATPQHHTWSTFHRKNASQEHDQRQTKTSSDLRRSSYWSGFVSPLHWLLQRRRRWLEPSTALCR